jgi:hypothetical protein
VNLNLSLQQPRAFLPLAFFVELIRANAWSAGYTHSGKKTVEDSVAKRRRRSRVLTSTAEGIGKTLGKVAARLDAWKRERGEIAAQIQAVAKSAQAMLAELGSTAAEEFAQRRRSRRRKGGRRKGYRMSEATKAKLRAAWRRRKAAKAAKRKNGGASPTA